MKRTIKRLVTEKAILRFLIVGVLSFAVDYAVLLILHNGFGVQLNIATSIAFLTGLLLNFTLNKIWTFNAPKGARQSATQAVQYGVLVAVNLFLTNLIVGGAAWVAIGPELSKPIATGTIMVLNYVVYQRIIFKHNTSVDPAEL